MGGQSATVRLTRPDGGDEPLPKQALLIGRVCALAAPELAATASSLKPASPAEPAQLPEWAGHPAEQLAEHEPTLRFLRGVLSKREAAYALPLEHEAVWRERRRACAEAEPPPAESPPSRVLKPAAAGACRALPPRQACALEVRLAEKQILRAWREWVDARLPGWDAAQAATAKAAAIDAARAAAEAHGDAAPTDPDQLEPFPPWWQPSPGQAKAQRGVKQEL